MRLKAQQDSVLTLDRTNWLHALGFCSRVRLDVHFPTLPADAVQILADTSLDPKDYQAARHLVLEAIAPK